MYPGMMWGGGFDGVGMFLFWVVFILFIVWLVRAATGHRMMMGGPGMHMMHGNQALDILKERYAKGEINQEEFEAKKKDLM